MTTPVSKFGKDHWSMLAYVETLCVDRKSGVGTIDPRKARCNEGSHPAKSFSPVAWKQSFSTRLLGYFYFQERADVDKAVGAGLQILGHDDWDCLDDLESAGFVEITSVANSFVRMTPDGLIASAKLREHKANGGMFAGFVLDNPSEALCEQ